MELQLVAHIASNEEGESVAVKNLTNEPECVLLQQGSNRIAANKQQLKEALDKIEEFLNSEEK